MKCRFLFSFSVSRGLVKKIDFLVDVQGFRVGKEYLVKEICVLSFFKLICWHFYVKLPTVNQMSSVDKVTIKYCTNHIHGLSFENKAEDVSWHLALKIILNVFQEKGESITIAYKGDNIIREIFSSAKCTVVNLEDVGINEKCLDLIRNFKHTVPDVTCKRHNNVMLRCSKVKCYILANYLKSKLSISFKDEHNLSEVKLIPYEPRCGEWMILSINREHFKRRVEKLEKTLTPVLENKYQLCFLIKNQVFRIE